MCFCMRQYSAKVEAFSNDNTIFFYTFSTLLHSFFFVFSSAFLPIFSCLAIIYLGGSTQKNSNNEINQCYKLKKGTRNKYNLFNCSFILVYTRIVLQRECNKLNSPVKFNLLPDFSASFFFNLHPNLSDSDSIRFRIFDLLGVLIFRLRQKKIYIEKKNV